MGFEFDLIVRLAIATGLGALLGLERSLAGKHAGMRTYALVAMGSCLFTVIGILSSYQFAMFTGVSPLHLAGFVIVGIGFIGAGLSAVRGDHPVELTTASGIWVVAGVGIASGFGYAGMAFAATIFGILVFSLLSRVERALRMRFGESYIGHE